MLKNIYPSPALIVLVVCGIAISYASQQQASYDPTWLAASTVLFLAGCLLSFNITRGLPAPQVRIVMDRATWQRAKLGLLIGIVSLTLSFGWLLWSLHALDRSGWTDVAIILGPTIILGLLGLILIYYWLGLWAFGQVQKDEPPSDAQDGQKE
jgi:hypothetical protein